MKRFSQLDLQRILDSAHRDFHNHFHRDRDPIQWPHRFNDPRDQEIAAFFSAILAYGNVATILTSLNRIFAALGPSPSHEVFASDLLERFEHFVHRFTRGVDIAIVCHWLKTILDQSGSIETFFGKPATAREGLESFAERIHALPLPPKLKSAAERRQRNLRYLISSPKQGSSCKRLNLFLRWVVRPNDGIDLGLWQTIDPSLLMLPIDTHVLKVIRELGWTRSRSALWKTSEEATERLRRLCPADPVRYDFALCHLSMSGFTIKGLYAQVE
ncbi:MAG: TIGR02757 family protein [Deltaproteobacteria bacterium]|nr:TIGR02757 family protein [Deltaproteobacteria bacterium]